MRTVSIIKTAGVMLACWVWANAGPLAYSQSKAPAKAGDAKSLKNPVKATPQSIDAGKAVFTQRCASCHGATGKGDAPAAAHMPIKPPNLTDDKWEHGSTDGDIFTTIHDGIGPKFAMKPFKDKVSDQDIWNVVNYIRSLGPKK